MWSKTIGGAALILSLGLAEPALANFGPADPVIVQVRNEGFTVTKMRKHWNGRVSIYSYNDTYMRKTVINGKTGKVLSDQLMPRKGDASDGTSVASTSGSEAGSGTTGGTGTGNGGSSSGGSSGGGSGSGGSGSGGSSGGSSSGGSGSGGSGGIGATAEASVGGGGISAGVGASVGGLGIGASVGIGKN